MEAIEVGSKCSNGSRGSKRFRTFGLSRPGCGPIIVEFTVRLGYAIFTVATLAFLGFAADPSIPDWGQDISAHYQSINAGYWWPVLFPSLAIATLINGINLIADSISQVFER